jgi:tetratricopeptide (TPR) repeat protein
VTLLQLSRAAEALQSCERAITARPGYADALYNRGNVLLALGRFEDARVSFTEALALEPARLDALNNLGLALAGLRRSPEALETTNGRLQSTGSILARSTTAPTRLPNSRALRKRWRTAKRFWKRPRATSMH